MPREINPKIDALFVEGPDDGAVVNALVQKKTGIDISKPGHRLVRTREEGGGDSWAISTFDAWIRSRPDARIGLIVDRDDGAQDKWPAIRERLRALGQKADSPSAAGAIVAGQYGIWMWPDNLTPGDLETFVTGIIPPSELLAYAAETSRIAKERHSAEYDVKHARKASLKVRSVWRDAGAAGGYGRLIRNLPLTETSASNAFLGWFQTLFLT